MDAVQYFTTHLLSFSSKIIPLLLFAAGGYLLFIKLPFLVFKKSITDQKKQAPVEPAPPQVEKKTKIELLLAAKPQQKKTQEKTQEKKQEKKEEFKRPEARRAHISPEEVLGFKLNEPFTQAELKKRYFEKLKENHPDRVASMGEDFKKLAEKNTTDLNLAYEKLKKKAA